MAQRLLRDGTVDPWPEDQAMGPVCHYPPTTVLFRQGETVSALYLVETGAVKLTRTEHDGRDLLIGLRTRGWLLGVASATLSRHHPVTAETLSPCELRQIRVVDFVRLQKANPSVGLWVQRMQARETYEQVALLGVIGTQPPQQRLERLLFKLIRAGYEPLFDGSVRLTIALKQQEIAEAIGTSREHVNRLIGQLERSGAIRREKGWLLVPSHSRLLQSAFTDD